MADPSAIVSSISTYRPDLEPALGDQAPGFFAQVEQLYGQVLAGSGDQRTQDRVGDGLLALVRQNPAADQLLRRIDPGTFGPPPAVMPVPDPAAARDVPAPPLPTTTFTPAAVAANGPSSGLAPESTATSADLPVALAVSAAPAPVVPATGAGEGAAPPADPTTGADRSLASDTVARGGSVVNRLFATGSNEVGMLSTGLLGVLKELVAALLGIVLVLGTVVIAFVAVLAGLLGKGADFQAAKDILLLMTSLAGVVLGYYYGRIPSEARADQAQQTATKAQADTAHAQSQVQVVRDQAGQLADQVGELATSVQAQGTVPATRALGGGLDPAQAEALGRQAEKLRQVQQALRDLARNNRA